MELRVIAASQVNPAHKDKLEPPGVQVPMANLEHAVHRASLA